MKKKIVFFLVVLFMATLNSSAEQSALLYNKNKVHVFTGYNAFRDAYYAAEVDDTITLSAGYFNTPEDHIRKRLYICGNGAFYNSECTIIEGSLTIEAEGTKIEGIAFTSDIAGVRVITNNVQLWRCYITILDFHSLTQMYARFGGTLIFQCGIRRIESLSYISNIYIYNSTIGSFEYDSVWGVNSDAKNSCVVNSVIYSSTELLKAVYENNIIEAKKSYAFYAVSEFHNNLFYADKKPTISFPSGCVHTGDMYSTTAEVFNNDNSQYYPAVVGNVPNGNDGKPVGIYGGLGYKPFPAIPSLFTIPNWPFVTNNFIFGQLNQEIEIYAISNSRRLCYWWNDDFDKKKYLYLDNENDQIVAQSYTLDVPTSIHGYGPQKGVATLHVIAVSPDDAMSAPINTDITYAIGPSLNASSYSLNEGNIVTLKWKDPTTSGSYYDYAVYYAIDDGPWNLWNSEATYDSTTRTYSAKFKGKKGTYRFVVSTRTNVSGIGYIRTPLENEWSVTVIFN